MTAALPPHQRGESPENLVNASRRAIVDLQSRVRRSHRFLRLRSTVPPRGGGEDSLPTKTDRMRFTGPGASSARKTRVLQRVDDSRWRGVRGRVPRAARRLPAPAHRRISGRRTLRARPGGGASRGGCQEREKKLRRAASRSPRGPSLSLIMRGLLICAHRSTGPAARGVASRYGPAAERPRHRGGSITAAYGGIG